MYDLLALGDESFMETPSARRRARLAEALEELEGDRLRHPARFVRWRPDREPLLLRLPPARGADSLDIDQVLAGTQ